MKRNFVVFFFMVTLVSHSAISQSFTKSYFDSNSGKLEYGFSLPENYDPTESYPLIMYLHGWSNNYPVYLKWYSQKIQSKNPCFVYSPKTPTTWADWSGWSDELTAPMKAAIGVLDSLSTIYSVDKSRLYVYGISMGGEGTFDLLDKYPKKFAAAISVCGGGKPEWADNIIKTPFWMFHGSADDINPAELTEQVYREMLKSGGKQMRYTNYSGMGHDIWSVAENEPAWNDWMFAHVKGEKNTPQPSGRIELKAEKQNEKIYLLSWNDIRNPKDKAEKIWYYKIIGTSELITTVEFDKTNYQINMNNLPDTVYVVGVNYHFKESEKSNSVIIK